MSITINRRLSAAARMGQDLADFSDNGLIRVGRASFKGIRLTAGESSRDPSLMIEVSCVGIVDLCFAGCLGEGPEREVIKNHLKVQRFNCAGKYPEPALSVVIIFDRILR